MKSSRITDVGNATFCIALKKHDMKNTETAELIASLRDHRTSLLIVDTDACPHSRRLVDDLKVICTLGASAPERRRSMHVMDLAKHEGKALDVLTWLPGVPCLLYQSNVHLGIDAFRKCRELARTDDGVVMHAF